VLTEGLKTWSSTSRDARRRQSRPAQACKPKSRGIHDVGSGDELQGTLRSAKTIISCVVRAQSGLSYASWRHFASSGPGPLNFQSVYMFNRHRSGTFIRALASNVMALVSYSDSEDSGDEKPPKSTKQNDSAVPTAQPPSSFAVDKSNPRKIQVKLQEIQTDAASNVGALDNEPAPKRQRIGGGAFSGFNSILPPPKRHAVTQDRSSSAKGQPRKVFSLKTGAERGFDRESDAELKQLFAEQHADLTTPGTNGTNTAPPLSISQPDTGSKLASAAPKVGNPMIFKPLSVARKPPKKKPATNVAKETSTQATAACPASEAIPKPMPKVSLFSSSGDLTAQAQSATVSAEYQPLVYELSEEHVAEPRPDSTDETHSGAPDEDAGQGEVHAPAGSQSLDAIASDLNLSASARRQLFGRKSGASNNAVNIINFNTDKEYAANEVLRASGEQIQHNPVRAPASGKHSLKQLVSLASGQKDALEESFAAGRQNKKEAGNRYGW